MTELVTFGETPLRFSPPEHQRLELADEAVIFADGMSTNVAVAAYELGADATWISKLPNTPLGKRVIMQIEAHGVETDVSWTDDREVRQGLTFLESGVDPRQERNYHDRGDTAVASSTPSDYPVNLVQQADVVFADLSTAVLSETATETTAALLRAGSGSDTVTAIDLAYAEGLADVDTYRTAFSELADQVDVFFGREGDVRTILDERGNPRELANLVASKYDFNIVVITRADRGAVTLQNSPGTNVIHERQTVDTVDVDPTGQHGAFIGAFLEELINGADAARALSYAVATAALARTIPGPFLSAAPDELDPIVEDVIDQSQ